MRCAGSRIARRGADELVDVTSCLARALGGYLVDKKIPEGYNLDQARGFMEAALMDLDQLY